MADRFITGCARLIWLGCVLLLAAAVLAVPAFVAPARPAAAETASAWRRRPVPSSLASQQGCADYLFVGVRGSGEPEGFGPTVTRARDGLSARWSSGQTGQKAPQGSVRQVWLEYPAADPHTLTKTPLESLLLDDPMPATDYFGSAETGSKNLAAVLEDSAERCPAERTILAGFSQGAQVITAALGSTPQAPSRLAAALLIGNPSHYPGQSVRELSGTASQNAIGLGAALFLLRDQAAQGAKTDRNQAVANLVQAMINLYEGRIDTAAIRTAMRSRQAEIPPQAYAASYSICLAGDLVCDAGQSLASIMVRATTLAAEVNRTRPIHLGYSDAVLAPTLDQIGQQLAALPPIATPPATAPPADQIPGWARARWLIAASALIGLGLVAASYWVGHRRGRSRARQNVPAQQADRSA